MHCQQPAECISCSLTETQKGYALIQKEFIKVLDGPAMDALNSCIDNYWPSTKNSCLKPLKLFSNVRLSADENITIQNDQVVVPLAISNVAIDGITKGHMRVSNHIERTKNTLHWPGYIGQIGDMIDSRATSQEHARANNKGSLEPFEMYPAPYAQC